MAHVLTYDGQYFSVDITEVVGSEHSRKPEYVSWCSEAFKELKDTPKQALSRFIPGLPFTTRDDARRHAYDWIKATWNRQKANRPKQAPDVVQVIYTV